MTETEEACRWAARYEALTANLVRCANKLEEATAGKDLAELVRLLREFETIEARMLAMRDEGAKKIKQLRSELENAGMNAAEIERLINDQIIH